MRGNDKQQHRLLFEQAIITTFKHLPFGRVFQVPILYLLMNKNNTFFT